MNYQSKCPDILQYCYISMKRWVEDTVIIWQRDGRTDLRFSQLWLWRVASSAYCLLHASFLFGLRVDPVDRGDVFLRNVGWLSLEYTALYPSRYNSSEPSRLEPQKQQIIDVWGSWMINVTAYTNVFLQPHVLCYLKVFIFDPMQCYWNYSAHAKSVTICENI
jgi:hypothetical protein